jgi:Protein of unknown function (DUF1826)
MAARDDVAGRADDAAVIRTCDRRELELILNTNVQAVIYTPQTMPAWFAEVARAVESGAFRISRAVLSAASYEEIKDELERRFPTQVLAAEVRTCLKQDILALVDQLRAISLATRLMLRIFTEAPTNECGFHVDTVPPASPVCGLLRVYNGEGTEYADPSNVTGMDDFYRYLARRERLVRERTEARRDGRAATQIDRKITLLDEERSFLVRRTEVRIAPAGSIVAFKHVDIRHHWSNHPKSMAWIHCSPMSGKPRLVVNLTALGSTARTLRRAAHAIDR